MCLLEAPQEEYKMASPRLRKQRIARVLAARAVVQPEVKEEVIEEVKAEVAATKEAKISEAPKAKLKKKAASDVDK